MKTQHLLVGILAIVILNGFVSGQDLWLPNGSHIYSTNSGNVGIGSTNPLMRFQVRSSLGGSLL